MRNEAAKERLAAGQLSRELRHQHGEELLEVSSHPGGLHLFGPCEHHEGGAGQGGEERGSDRLVRWQCEPAWPCETARAGLCMPYKWVAQHQPKAGALASECLALPRGSGEPEEHGSQQGLSAHLLHLLPSAESLSPPPTALAVHLWGRHKSSPSSDWERAERGQGTRVGDSPAGATWEEVRLQLGTMALRSSRAALCPVCQAGAEPTSPSCPSRALTTQPSRGSSGHQPFHSSFPLLSGRRQESDKPSAAEKGRVAELGAPKPTARHNRNLHGFGSRSR